ncbi:hypothetical protein [Aureibacillus halotolerans]|uniref:Uncharacterized protein n=1 Tax=Aureibacillus halotolerans TaxID=1508390 RepID=A0A4V3D686_9BACI|nr:hypothetical protein [Aureibacillus halotolerans]TDQ42977.1 hypothetical protein EV213_101409 [Aureibacillus halotolerans]
MSKYRILKLISGAYEALLGIPILGGLIVISFLYVPLFIALILHIVTLIVSRKNGGPTAGSLFGILTSCLAWIPFLGMAMHMISALVLLMEAVKEKPMKTYHYVD